MIKHKFKFSCNRIIKDLLRMNAFNLRESNRYQGKSCRPVMIWRACNLVYKSKGTYRTIIMPQHL